jgi:hypothetical protein
VNRNVLGIAIIAGAAWQGWAQDVSRATDTTTTNPPEPANKRIFWLIPNYRTYPTMKEFRPITAKEKFKIVRQDILDPGTFILSAAFAGKSQLLDDNPSFGQGMEGYAKRFATAYADFAIGDVMTEAVFPSLLHHDPRYFRRGEGSFPSRLGYAMSQIFVTHTDSGHRAFNISELAGNATSVAISNAYYSEDRNAGSAAAKWGVQVGLDMSSNVLKEFWPDIERILQRKHAAGRKTR